MISSATASLSEAETSDTLTMEVQHILIGKRDRTYAEGLGALCGRTFPGVDVQVRDRAATILSALHVHEVDLLLLGLSFPDMDAMELLQKINLSGLAHYIVLVTEQRDEPLLTALQTARADAIIDTTTEHINSVQDALRLVAEQQMYVSPSLRPYIIDRLPLPRLHHDLTAGEMRVIQVIGTGSDNQEAADMLGLSEATVQTHRRNIMRKLKVSTSAKLVREAIRLGLAHVTPTEDSVL